MLKKLIKYNNIVELKKIEVTLQNNDIKFLNRSFEDTAYDGLYTQYYGLGEIFVYEEDLEKARNLLKKEGILKN